MQSAFSDCCAQFAFLLARRRPTQAKPRTHRPADAFRPARLHCCACAGRGVAAPWPTDNARPCGRFRTSRAVVGHPRDPHLHGVPGRDRHRDGRPLLTIDEMRQEVLGMHPIGRMDRPEEIAQGRALVVLRRRVVHGRPRTGRGRRLHGAVTEPRGESDAALEPPPRRSVTI